MRLVVVRTRVRLCVRLQQLDVMLMKGAQRLPLGPRGRETFRVLPIRHLRSNDTRLLNIASEQKILCTRDIERLSTPIDLDMVIVVNK